VEKRFREWALRIFGGNVPFTSQCMSSQLTQFVTERESEWRNMFLFERDPNTKPDTFPPDGSQTASSEASSSSSATAATLSHQLVPQESSSQELAPRSSHPSLPVPASIRQASVSSGSSEIAPTPTPDTGMPQTSTNPLMQAPPNATSESLDVTQPLQHVAGLSQSTTDTLQTVAEHPPRDIVESRQVAAQSPSPAVVGSPPHVVVQPSPQVVTQPSPQVVAQPSPQVVARPFPDPAATPVAPKSLMKVKSTSGPVPKVPYRVRGLLSGNRSRRGSIEGAPDMVVDVIDEDRGVSVDLREFITLESDDDGSHVSSSQKTADGRRELLSPPSGSEQVIGRTGEEVGQSEIPSARVLLDVDEGDLPTWMTKRGQWRYVASTAGGTSWEKLLNIYMAQERRLEFTETVSDLTHLSHLWS
jgi:hypothetical protein